MNDKTRDIFCCDVVKMESPNLKELSTKLRACRQNYILTTKD